MNDPALSSPARLRLRALTILTLICLLSMVLSPLAAIAQEVEITPVGDTTAPIVTVPADISLDAAPEIAEAIVDFDVSAVDDTDGVLIPTCDWTSGSAFPAGTTTVTCEAIDAAGNAGAASFTVTVNPAPTPVATDTPSTEPATETPTVEPATDTPTVEPATNTAVPEATSTEAPLATSTSVPTATTTTTGPPWIASDKDDYPPGALVTLTSGGWQPAEQVRIFVNDDSGSSWSRTIDVVADDGGNLVDVFNLPDWFVATYSVRATGASGAIATTSFTDARIVVSATLNGGSSVTVATDADITAVVNVTTDGSGANARWRCTEWRIATSPGTGNNERDHGNHDSAGTSSETFTINAPSEPGTYNAYFQAFNDDGCDSTGNASLVFTLSNAVTVKDTTSVDIDRTAGNNNNPYGNSLTFRATVSGEESDPDDVGAVTFRSGATVLCNALPLNGDEASCSPVLNVGSHSVTAEYSGTASYFASTSSGFSQTITARPITVTAQAKSKIFGAADPPLTYTITSGALVGSDGFTGALTRVAGENVGSYAIQRGTLTLGSNYAITFVGANLSITKANQTVAFTTSAPAAAKFGDIYEVAATASSSLVVSFGASGACTFGSGTVSMTGVGTCTVTANQSGNGNYNAALQQTQQFEVGKQDQTITFPQPVTPATFNTTFAVTTSATSGLTVTVAASGACSISGDQVTMTSGAGVCTLTASQGGNGNYNAADPVMRTVEAAKASATLSIEDLARTYTGSPQGATVVTDPAGLSGVTVTYDDSPSAPTDAGSYEVAASLSHADYAADPVTDTLVIAPLEVTGSFTAANKTYDGSMDAVITSRSLTGTVGADDVSLSGGTASFDAANAGVARTVTGTGFALGGTDAGNYSLGTVNPATADIEPRPITVTADAKTKVFGDDDPALTFLLSEPLVSADSFTGELVRDSGETAGTYAITLGNLMLSSNYALTFEGAMLTITAKGLTITAEDVSAVYGDAIPAFTVSYDGFVSGDTEADLAGTPTFGGAATTTTDAGSYAIEPGGLTSANYAITFVPGTLTITPRLLTVTADPQTRIYGELDPTLTYEVTAGNLVGDDDLTGDLTRVAGEDVGTYQILRGGLTAGSNYLLTFLGDALTITPKPLVGSFTASDKEYDGTVAASVAGSSLPGVVDGDDVTLSVSNAAFANANVDAGKDVTADLSLGGAQAGNYTVNATATTTASITAKAVTGSFTANDKTYDGTTNAVIVSRSLDGVIGDDDVSLIDGTASFDSASVGANKTVTGSGFALSGIDAGNYILASSTLTTTASIGTQTITVTANPQSAIYGEDDPALTFSYTGTLAAGDTFSGALSRAEGVDVGSYSITQGDLALSSNYTLTFTGNTFTITARPIEISAIFQTKVYGETDPALTYSITAGSLVGGDDFTGALSRTEGEDVGSYDIIQGSLLLTSNYELAFEPNTLEIQERPITANADPQAKAYGAADPMLTYSVIGDLVGTDDFSGSLTRAPGEVVGTYAITQGTLALSSNYILSFTGSTLTIGQAVLSVNAEEASRVYGEANPTVSYTLSGFLNGDSTETVTTTGSADCTVSADVTTDAGVYADAVECAPGTLATANYSFAAGAKGTLTVNQREIEVAADDLTKVYGDSDPPLTYGIANGTLVNGDTFTGALVREEGEDVGAYAILPGSVSLESNYNLTIIPGSLEITPRPITVTANDLSKNYGDDDPPLTFTVSAALVSGDDFAGSLSRDAGEAAGLYPIRQGTLSLSANYELTFVEGSFVIGRATLTVTANDKLRVYGDANPALDGTITGFTNGDTLATSDVLGVADLMTGATEASNVGSYAITAAIGTLSSSNYGFTFVNGALTISPRAIDVTANSQTKGYGEDDPALTFGVTGTLVAGDAFSGALSRIAGEDVGSYAINQGDLELNGNYVLSFTGNLLTIAPREIEISADFQTKVYGEIDPALTYSITGGSLVGGDVPTGSLSRFAGEDAGSYEIIQGSLLLSSNYELSFEPNTLEILERPITITANAQGKVYGETEPTLSYGVTGELVGSDAFSGSLARESGDAVGTYAIAQGTLGLSTNYTVSFVGAVFTITVREVSGSFTVADKIHDGTTAATIVTRSLAAVVDGDDVALLGGTATFDTADVGVAKTVTGNGFTLTGADAANYSLISSTLTTTASITAPDSDDQTAPSTRIRSAGPDELENSASARFTFAGSDDVTAPEELTFECQLDGGAFTTCLSPLIYSGLGEGPHTFSVRAIDEAGNADLTPSSYGWTIDTVEPLLSLPANITMPGARSSGATVRFTATAYDAVSGSVKVKCSPFSGSTFRYGPTTVRCEAKDKAGNKATGLFLVTVTYRIRGFFQPVDMGETVNTVRAGRTVPLRFEVFAGGSEVRTRAVVTSLTYSVVPAFPAGTPRDGIEETTSGETSLRFDSGSGRFVYYWRTPNLPAGTCLIVTITFRDGTTISAKVMLT